MHLVAYNVKKNILLEVVKLAKSQLSILISYTLRLSLYNANTLLFKITGSSNLGLTLVSNL
jgi:hypothetical protein